MNTQTRRSRPCTSAEDCSSSCSSSSSSSSCSAEPLSVEGVAAILARVTYRPGWEFSADGVAGRVRVRMVGTVDNARAAGRMDFGIDAWPPVDAFNDEPAFLQWLLGRLVEHEVHEAREWLRCDGAIVDDPHGAFG